MFNVVLVHPEIPPNTGNIIRLCANTGATLHLIEPLGFPIDHAKLRRAGLDYHEFAAMRIHASWEAFLHSENPARQRLFAFTSKGGTPFLQCLQDGFEPGDWFVFGSETRGLPSGIVDSFDAGHRVRLPMRPGNRSINLSNAVAIVVFEAWRQQGYAGGG